MRNVVRREGKFMHMQRRRIGLAVGEAARDRERNCGKVKQRSLSLQCWLAAHDHVEIAVHMWLAKTSRSLLIATRMV